MTSATSAGSAGRPIGIRRRKALIVSSSERMPADMSVAVRLGCTALTRTPSLAWSSAMALVRLVTAPLAAL